MAYTRSQIQARYDSKNRKGYTIKLNYNYDNDVIQKLDSVESINGYIKQLIRNDISKNSVPVSFSDAALSILAKKAEEKGMSVPELIALVVNEQLIRT